MKAEDDEDSGRQIKTMYIKYAHNEFIYVLKWYGECYPSSALA